MNLLDYILNEINRTDFFNILEQKDKGSNFFYCPFHKEKTPSLYLYDSLRFYCFSCKKYGNYIDILSFIKNKSIKDTVDELLQNKLKFSIKKKYQSEFNLKENNHLIYNNFKANFTYIKKKFTLTDKKYWFDKYKINRVDLDYYDVFPIDKLILNDIPYWYHYDDNPIYRLECYNFSSKEFYERFYRPLNTEKNGKNSINKWRGNTKKNSFFGLKQILYYIKYNKNYKNFNNNFKKDIIIITSSLKDCIVLTKLNFFAIAPINECNELDINLLNFIKKYFNNIYVLFDNDATGIKNSNLICENYNLKNIVLPEKYYLKNIKDPADFAEKKNYRLLEEIINYSL